MAIANLAAVAELIKEHYETPFTESMVRSNALTKRLKRKNMVGGSVQWKVHYAGNTSVGSYAEEDTIPTAVAQSYLPAEVSVRQVWGAVEATGLAQASTRGAGGFQEALSSNVRETLEDLKNEIEKQILDINSTVDATNIDGLPTIVSASGTYAGINRATYTWWGSYEHDAASAALTLAMMQSVSEVMSEPTRYGADISVILTGKGHYYDYGNLLLEYRRYVNEETLDGGFKALDFEGVPVVAIPRMASGKMFFLDESEWFYYTLQNFETTPKSTTKDSDYFLITHYANLVCKHPGKQAVIKNLA